MSKEKKPEEKEKNPEEAEEKSEKNPEENAEENQTGGRIENLLREIRNDQKKQGTILGGIGEFIAGFGSEKEEPKKEKRTAEAVRRKSIFDRCFPKKDSGQEKS